MKPFDPDFSDLSDEQLAEIDALCTDYEGKRTQGIDVSVEAYVLTASVAIRSALQLELIQIELEILDAWDQLNSPDAMFERFPKVDAFIRNQWQLLKTRTGSHSAQQASDTQRTQAATGSTHDDGQIATTAEKSVALSPISDVPSPRFRIIRNLAQGGIGTVFVAYDRDLQREVAIKELKRKFANVRSVVERFEAEATVTGNLEHPNIVPIYAIGRRSDGRPYYAMRLVRGRSMQVVIAELHKAHGEKLDFRNQPEARDLLFRFVTVCRAVGFAHSHDVLHRDLKASNIMVGDFGETLVVDWGLARNLRSLDHTEQTATPHEANTAHRSEKTLHGTIVGTPGYMSPEQAMGRTDEMSVASDIYSLGATLFQIVTSTVPHGHEHGPQETVAKFDTAPAPLKAICQRAMAFDPHARYASAELLAADLEAWLLDAPVSVLPDSRLQKIQRWAKAHPALVGSGLASLLITLVAMGVTLSILSAKNETLRLSYLREQASAEAAAQHAADAKISGDEAVRQRQRVLGILNTFLMDVERGLANVPGSASVQRNVLTTVLNKLGEISNEFASEQVNQSNALALVEMGDLFSRVGTKDIKLELPRSSNGSLSPLEAAGEMYAEAMEITLHSHAEKVGDQRRTIALIKQKQAEVLRQTARTPEALKLIEESLSIRQALLNESPASMEAAMDVVSAVDYQGQIHLQNGDFPNARMAFVETQAILKRLAEDSPSDNEIKRRLGIALSRLADIAVHDGDLELATQLYNQDMAISRQLYESSPNNITAKRDLCSALDRIGNISATRGHLEEAMVSYAQSRQLRDELHAAEPTDTKVSLELMVSYMKCGDTRMLLKEVAKAQADYGQALVLSDELARLDPQNARVRRFQSLSAEVLADVALAQMQYAAALGFAMKSLAISQELAAKDPTNGEMQRDLYICHVKVAKVLLGQKDFAKCLGQLDLALNIVQPIYQRQPESLQSLGDYSFVLLKRAEAYLEATNAPAALEDLEMVIPLLESVLESNQQDAKSRRRLANAITMLGRALMADGQSTQARSALERSRKMTVAMIDEKVRVEQMQLDLTEINGLIASIVEKQ